MGVFFAAMVVDALAVGVAARLLGGRLVRRMRSREGKNAALALSCAAALILFAALFYPVLLLLWSTTVVKGVDVSLGDYRGIGPRLPPSTLRITYYSDYQGTQAVFGVREEEFAMWTSREGWKREEVRGKKLVCLRHPDIERAVTDGIVAEELFHPRGTGITLVFDRKEGTCYYRYSSYWRGSISRRAGNVFRDRASLCQPTDPI